MYFVLLFLRPLAPSNGHIRVDVTVNGLLSYWASAINITMEGYNVSLPPQHRYHAVYEVQVNAT